jgi:hypothetical protein
MQWVKKEPAAYLPIDCAVWLHPSEVSLTLRARERD